MSEKEKKSFFTTLPGVLSGIAGVITAISGLYIAVAQSGLISPPAPASISAPEPVVAPDPTFEPEPANSTLSPGNYTISAASDSTLNFLSVSDVQLHSQKAPRIVIQKNNQANSAEKWILRRSGDNEFMIQDGISGRYMDASEKDYGVYVLAQRQGNATQDWILNSLGNGTYTIQQQSSGRYLTNTKRELGQNQVSLSTQEKTLPSDRQAWILTQD